LKFGKTAEHFNARPSCKIMASFNRRGVAQGRLQATRYDKGIFS
jgi:hypothetical protein